MSVYEKLHGASGRFWAQKDTVFFKPYTSVKDGVVRVASIVTAPVMFAIHSASALLETLASLLRVASGLLEGNVNGRDSVTTHLGDACEQLIGCAFMLLTAFVSPIANAVDVIGSGVTSLTSGESQFSGSLGGF